MFKKNNILIVLAFVLISCVEKDTFYKKSSEKSIINFSIPEFSSISNIIIDSLNKKISITLHANADTIKTLDLRTLKPIVKLSDRATVSPISGSNVDLSNVVNYIVTAENGEHQTYSVEVIILPGSGEGYILAEDDINLRFFNFDAITGSTLKDFNKKSGINSNMPTKKLVSKWGGTIFFSPVEVNLYFFDFSGIHCQDGKFKIFKGDLGSIFGHF